VVRAEGGRQCRCVRQEGMIAMVILGPLEFHGAIDAWTEYLCMERLMDGSFELSSRSRELLGYCGDWFGEPVWPEGYSPDAAYPDASEEVSPLTVGGKAIFGRDRDGVVGHGLVPHSDDAVAVFRRGQFRDARVWLEDYGWSRAPSFGAAMEMINAALSTGGSRRSVGRGGNSAGR
jgi:hypothetical protein